MLYNKYPNTRALHIIIKSRMFSSINSAALPLNSTGKLKIYSALSNGFRLTNGIKHEQAGLAIIGSNHFNWNSECEESIKTVLRVLRPLPEIVVLGGFKTGNFSISEEFGCAVEAAENKMTAAETFNTLIDDNRRVIGFFKL
jgi:hypothetical protein